MSIKAQEESIVDQLRARLIDSVPADQRKVLEVYGHQDYATVAEVNMVTPSLAVIYNGYGTGSTPGAKSVSGVTTVTFSWIVVANVGSATAAATGDGVRDAFSPIFDAVLEALLGFRPSKGFTPLTLEPAPGAAVSDAGFGYYPIQFTTSKTYRGTAAN